VDVALALAAAFFFALGLVLQEKAASEQPDETVGAGFLVRLVRQPIWLLGLAMQGVGFVAQAIALGVGAWSWCNRCSSRASCSPCRWGV
jgi:threonine/homoserine efflux transporter RhtA